MIFVIYFWFAFSVLAGVLAKRRGRDAAVWAFASAAFSPVVVVPLILLLPDKTKARCNVCFEWIHKDAKKCRHCGAA